MSEDNQAFFRDDCFARLLMIADVVIDVFDPPSSLNGFIINSERILDRHARGQKIAPLRDAVVGIGLESNSLTLSEINRHVQGRTHCRNKTALERCICKRGEDGEFNNRYQQARSQVMTALQGATPAADPDSGDIIAS